MKIRSITCFYDPGASGAGDMLDMLGRFSERAIKRFGEAGFEVQSRRLATIPFAEMCPSGCLESGVLLAQKLEEKALSRGFAYVSMGPALPENPESYAMIPEMLAETRSVFFSANLLQRTGRSRLPRSERQQRSSTGLPWSKKVDLPTCALPPWQALSHSRLSSRQLTARGLNLLSASRWNVRMFS